MSTSDQGKAIKEGLQQKMEAMVAEGMMASSVRGAVYVNGKRLQGVVSITLPVIKRPRYGEQED